jgi:hypothetical protein
LPSFTKRKPKLRVFTSSAPRTEDNWTDAQKEGREQMNVNSKVKKGKRKIMREGIGREASGNGKRRK